MKKMKEIFAIDGRRFFISEDKKRMEIRASGGSWLSSFDTQDEIKHLKHVISGKSFGISQHSKTNLKKLLNKINQNIK